MERYTTIQVVPYFAEGEKYPGLIGVKAEGDEYETAYVCKAELIAAIEERDALKAYIDRKEHIHSVFEKDKRIRDLESLVRDMWRGMCGCDPDCRMCDCYDTAFDACSFKVRMDDLGVS